MSSALIQTNWIFIKRKSDEFTYILWFDVWRRRTKWIKSNVERVSHFLQSQQYAAYGKIKSGKCKSLLPERAKCCNGIFVSAKGTTSYTKGYKTKYYKNITGLNIQIWRKSLLSQSISAQITSCSCRILFQVSMRRSFHSIWRWWEQRFMHSVDERDTFLIITNKDWMIFNIAIIHRVQ